MKALSVSVITALTVIGVALGILQAVSPFVPHAFFGVNFDSGGRVYHLFPAELPPGIRIAVGDHVIERPNGNLGYGYRLHNPHLEDMIHVVTQRGRITLHARPAYYPWTAAIGEALRHTTGTVLIAVAGVLFFRRPGMMAFALWIWAISELGGFDLDVALKSLPWFIAIIPDMVLWSAFSFSGLALISFALRFPSGDVPAGLRWLDRIAWIVLAGAFVGELVQEWRYYAFGAKELAPTGMLLSELAMLGAIGILLWKYSRADAGERSRIAWANVAFVGAAVVRAIVLGLFAVAVFFERPPESLGWRLLLASANLFLLLAAYPVLRYRLFDIGFVVNRATLYSTLTLAAFATLAAANWVAQHFFTDRLAFVLQPVAAVAIGIGYFRVRNWAQKIIERLLFRDRFAAEERLEATIRGLAFVERSASVDDVLVTEVVRTLRLASAALFRLTPAGFERGPSIGWPAEMLANFPRDDALARAAQANGPIVSLRSVDWQPRALPPQPEEPVFALGILRRGILAAIVLYGRHANGTEVEPEEFTLLRRLGGAAALAYETAEVVALRERNQVLEDHLQRLEVRSL
jgi:hypothetical protein